VDAENCAQKCGHHELALLAAKHFVQAFSIIPFALDGVDLRVEGGRILGMIGRNGRRPEDGPDHQKIHARTFSRYT
jgi:hypothetical protein